MRHLLPGGNFLIFSFLLACSSDPSGQNGSSAADDALVAARPYDSQEPAGYDPQQPTPLVLVLHGYMASGALESVYLGMSALVDSAGFLLASPDGTTDLQGNQFWNATDACCDIYGTGVDDVAYLRAVVHDMKKHYNVDPQRVFVVGHSNGGFMGYRLACDLSDELAGVVSLAGATWEDPNRCHPTSKVSILEIHGDADTVVRYDGGGYSPPLIATYPSAPQTVAQWANNNGCTGALVGSGMPLDLVSDLPGAETEVTTYSNCPQAAVGLWTIKGGTHIPLLLPSFGTSVYSFLLAHPKNS